MNLHLEFLLTWTNRGKTTRENKLRAQYTSHISLTSKIHAALYDDLVMSGSSMVYCNCMTMVISMYCTAGKSACKTLYHVDSTRAWLVDLFFPICSCNQHGSKQLRLRKLFCARLRYAKSNGLKRILAFFEYRNTFREGKLICTLRSCTPTSIPLRQHAIQ